MINNFLTVVKSLPKQRVIFLLLLSIVLTGLTSYLFSDYIYSLIINSVTLSSMNVALADIIGYAKYQRVLGFIQAFSNVFLFLIFIGYIYLFYRYEKNRQYSFSLKKIMNEIAYVAEGNFNYQIQTQHNNDLNQLATDINNIVLRLKNAIADERHIEHTKNELITNVSHDLRTPLTAIITYTDLLKNEEDEDKRKEYIEVLEKK